MPLKVVWALLGLVPVLLAFSGAQIWWHRRLKIRQSDTSGVLRLAGDHRSTLKVAWFLWYGLPVGLWAQTATLHGVVTDTSGAAVPSAQITLAAQGHASRMEKADGQGAYVFDRLAPRPTL